MMSKSRIRKILWASLLGFIVLFVVSKVYKSESNYKLLAVNGELVVATIDGKDNKNYKRSEIIYKYSFKFQGDLFRRKVQYHYFDNDLELNIGDRIYVLFLKENPEINCDYRFLKEENYGVDTIKYQKIMDSIGFREPPHKDDSNYIKIKH